MQKSFNIITTMCLAAQPCPTLCNLMDCSPPGSSVLGDSPGKNTEVGCHALLQGIFPTQRLNPGLPHCKWILYCLSHQGSPITTQSILFYPIIVSQAIIFITILPLQKTIRNRLLPTMKMRIPKFQSRHSDLRVQLFFYFCQTRRTK